MRIRATALAALFAAACCAQTFRGDLAGTVTDSSGAALVNAIVRLENPSTGFSRSMNTTANGDFLFAELQTGIYQLTVSQPGFQVTRIANLEVSVAKTTNVPVQLAVAQQQSVIEVSATAVSLETTTTALVAVVDDKAVRDMPMNGRDFKQMIKLAPGVTPSGTSINGMRTNGANYQIDGADNNDAYSNAVAVNQGGVSGIAGALVPIEALDQFSVRDQRQRRHGPQRWRGHPDGDQVGHQRSARRPVLLRPQRGSGGAFAAAESRQPEAGDPQQPVRLRHRRAHRQKQNVLLPYRRSAAGRGRSVDSRYLAVGRLGGRREPACCRNTACR